MSICENEMDYFWKKKTIVSYILCIFVLWIHISASFSGYEFDQNGVSAFVAAFQIIVTKTITPVAVPLFFVISGAVWFRNYSGDLYPSKIKKTIRSLVIPYLAWNTLNMLFSIVASYSFLSDYFVGREKFQINVWSVINAILFRGCYRPFWFVFCLILYRFASPIIDFALKKKQIAVIVFLLLAGLASLDIETPIDILYYALHNTIYYFIGCYIGKYHFGWFTKKTKGLGVINIVVFVAGMAYMYYVSAKQIHEYQLIRMIVILMMVFSFWHICDSIIPHIQMREFHKHSFFVYAMHLNIMACFAKVFYIAMPKNVLFAIPNFLLTTISTLVVIEIFCVTLKRFWKNGYMLLSGDR